MYSKKLSLKERIFIFKLKFIFELRLIESNDNEFKCYLKALKYSIWLSIFYIMFNILITSIGYY